MDNLDEYLDSARAAARAGAEVLRAHWGRRLNVENKRAFDYVTDADLASENEVLSFLRSRHPSHDILSEETPADLAMAQAQGGPLWVVDPLDGTTNFIHGFPHVAVSVGLLLDGRPAVGVVVDVTKDEEFFASLGGGAWQGSRRLKATDLPQDRALLMTGFPFREKDILEPYLQLFTSLFSRCAGVRRAGAAALDLAYVAAGRGQGFWELGLKPWDLAAGLLLVSEAGGMVSDIAGGDKALWSGDVVAAAPETHPWILAECRRFFADRAQSRG
ncbi:MAG: inositol monophosphatase [Desulfarculaceae bacterium]|nr:inositol monophosphatase [Desulfarculaceae bacterium]MCF8072714.1 inositol monophosphatase [Desulfarculaceae bacterium]MCF8102593.1 inositol monophosphatase [Desulfarculaceae bacterium]MCF8116502.1 inositol monophosphatase [Desulfarculaceae bacterium]